MDFLMETITPDTFYHNLLLGLPQALRKFKKLGVRKSRITRFSPAPPEVIAAWEQTHDIIMPEDMKNFYGSSNGFLYQWSCTYGHKGNIIFGKIDVNSIENLTQLAGYRIKSSPSVSLSGSAYLIRLGYASKVFEVCSLDGDTKVCLVYLDKQYVPTIWLCSRDMKFHFLADSFTKYLCMAISHLGLPNWALLYTPDGVPKWSAGIMQLLCPGILMQNKRTRTIELMKNQRIVRAQAQDENAEINTLDPKVFVSSSFRKQLLSPHCSKRLPEKSVPLSQSPTKKRGSKAKLPKKYVSKTFINLKAKKIK